MKSLSKNNFKFKLSAKNKIAGISKLPYLKLVYIAIGVNTAVILGILIFQNLIPPEVPLFYGLPEGNTQVANSEELIIPSMISLLVILTNISVSSILQNDYLKRVLIIVSIIITLLSLITTLEILYLVGNFR